MSENNVSVFMANDKCYRILDKEGNLICVFAHSLKNGVIGKNNATKYVSAINNTFGVGINPEAVPDIKKVLIELLAQFEKVVEPKYTLDFMLIREAKAAIEKATKL